MKQAAVLGSPIAHSLSPHLHGYWFERLGIEGRYEAIDTPESTLHNCLEELNNKGYSGVNLTVPLKEAVLPLLHSQTPVAQKIGAVNLLTFTDSGYKGENTDAYGFIENLRASIDDLESKLPYVVVLGAGGAARAVISALLSAGAETIIIANRTLERAQALAGLFGSEKLRATTLAQLTEYLPKATLLVNTTVLGMQGKPALQLSLSSLSSRAVVADIVYNPLRTRLLKQAHEQGNVTVEGLGMLIWQAVPSFEAFFGATPPVDAALYEFLYQKLRAK